MSRPRKFAKSVGHFFCSDLKSANDKIFLLPCEIENQLGKGLEKERFTVGYVIQRNCVKNSSQIFIVTLSINLCLHQKYQEHIFSFTKILYF